MRHLAVTCAALALGSHAAADELDVYGRINLTLQNSDEAAGEHVELRNNSSRIGVKGELEINADLKAIYQLEFGVNIDGDSSQDTFTHRNQFVGLEGKFGTVKAGRHDTALKEAQGDFDLFNDLEGDITGTFNGENRLRNYIAYTTPALGKAFHITVNVFPGEESETGDDGVADGTSFSIDYETELVYVAVAHDRDLDGEGVETSRLVGGYTLGDAQIMLLYQRTDAGAFEEDGFGASLAWTFGKNTAKFQYLTADIWRIDPQADPLDNRYESLISVGLDHALGKDTKVFGFYTAGDIGGGSENNRYLAVGIQHNF
jgi:predicted porin